MVKFRRHCRAKRLGCFVDGDTTFNEDEKWRTDVAVPIDVARKISNKTAREFLTMRANERLEELKKKQEEEIIREEIAEDERHLLIEKQFQQYLEAIAGSNLADNDTHRFIVASMKKARSSRLERIKNRGTAGEGK